MDNEPVFVPTREQRRQVCLMVSSKWDVDMMARDLRISKKCLRKHFRDELKNGAELVEKYAQMAFRESAFRKSSISALKTLAGIDKKPEGVPPAPKEAKAPVLGKKEQRRIEAREEAAGIYAVPKPPAHVNGRSKPN